MNCRTTRSVMTICIPGDTPLRKDALPFRQRKDGQNCLPLCEIMHTPGLDLTDDSQRHPTKVAKMYVQERFSAVSIPPTNPKLPCLKTNTNTSKCWWKKTSVLFQPEHHFVPSLARHIAYIAKRQGNWPVEAQLHRPALCQKVHRCRNV